MALTLPYQNLETHVVHFTNGQITAGAQVELKVPLRALDYTHVVCRPLIVGSAGVDLYAIKCNQIQDKYLTSFTASDPYAYDKTPKRLSSSLTTDMSFSFITFTPASNGSETAGFQNTVANATMALVLTFLN